MKSNKILPVKYPYITSFPSHANLISILSTNEACLPWLYNYYIQLEISRSMDPELKLDFAVGSATGHLKNCPFISFHGVSRDFIKTKWNSIPDFFIDCIDQNYYIYLLVDVYDIPCYEAYRQWHFPHDIMVYGYDREKESFHVADFFKYNKYEYTTASFSEIEAGYRGFDSMGQGDWLEGAVLLSADNKTKSGYCRYTFDAGLAVDLIKDYLASRNSYYRNRYIQWRLDNSQWAFGLEIYKKLKEYVELVILNEGMEFEFAFYVRSFHVLYDHKAAILKLMGYLEERGCLKDAGDLCCRYSRLKETALSIRNNMIKYVIKRDGKLLMRISDMLTGMAAEEEEIFEELVENIRVEA